MEFLTTVLEVPAYKAAEKRSDAIILSPFAVILSAAKSLALPAQGKLREGSTSEWFEAMRHSSFALLRTTIAPHNDSALRVFPQPLKPPPFVGSPKMFARCEKSVFVRSALDCAFSAFFYIIESSGGAPFHRFDCSASFYRVRGCQVLPFFDPRASAHSYAT